MTVRAAAFDLGDTLVEYEGVPLSWEDHYPEALGLLANYLGRPLTPTQIDHASSALRRHNTRVHPREKEITFAVVLRDLQNSLELPGNLDLAGCARAFFDIFRQRLRRFPDAVPTLAALRQQGKRIGICTDVPYGMPSELVREDVAAAGLGDTFDELVTSVEAGFRKPSPVGLRRLAEKLECSPHEMFYVGNERKDVEAAKAFGCAAILLDRAAHRHAWGQDRTIASLKELGGIL
jgi:putative hydrolase of the HAD superfamily